MDTPVVYILRIFLMLGIYDKCWKKKLSRYPCVSFHLLQLTRMHDYSVQNFVHADEVCNISRRQLHLKEQFKTNTVVSN